MKLYMKEMKKFITILLVFALFLSGMCLKEISSDSFFSFPDTPQSESTFDLLRSQVTEPVFRTEEILNHQECFSPEIRNRRTTSSYRLKPISDFINIENFSFSYALFSIFAVFVICSIEFCATIIIYYIHHKDGKKIKSPFINFSLC